MKRKTVKTVICATLMTIAMSVTACGSSDDGAKSADTAATVEETSTETTAPETEAPAEDKAADKEESNGQKTLEEFLFEDPTMEEQLKEQAAAQGNDQMDMEVEVKGNDFIIVATLKDSIEITDDTAAQLQDGMDSVGSVFSTLAGALDDAIGAEKGTVSYGIRYCAPDGTVLAEASFSAE